MTLKFEEDKVNLFFEVDAEDAVSYTMVIYAKDKTNNGSKKKIYTSNKHPLGSGKNHYWIIMDYIFYNKTAKIVATSGKPLPNQIEFFFELEVEIQSDKQCATEKEELDETLTLHFVRYMPKVLNILGWNYGENFQRIWFTEGNLIEREKEDPKLDAIDWSWIMTSSGEARDEYIEFMNDTRNELMAFFDNAAKRSLSSEINKMIKEGLTTLPTQSNTKTNFGVYDNEIITKKSKRFPNGEKMPKFEKYYFNSKSFGGAFDLGKHYIRNGKKFDDFIAALATFNFHVLASGYLTYKEGGYFSSPYTEVTVTNLGFYVKDSFDFIDDDTSKPSQPLGFWKIVDSKNIDVQKDPKNKGEYYEVTNKNYRDYRDEHNMGYNFHLYSNIFKTQTLISFKL